jgi:hypothetical protein
MSNIIKHIICAISGHAKIPSMYIEEFFLRECCKTMTINCERCHVPLLLEKDPDDPDGYFITEDP